VVLKEGEMDKSEKLLQDFGMRIVKLCIIVAVLFVFRYIISLVKVFDEVRFFDTRLTFLDIIQAALNTVVLIFVLKFGFSLQKNYSVANFTKGTVILKWLVIVIALIIAYKTYYELARQLLNRRDFGDAYNITFLCLSLAVLARLSMLIFSEMDKITDIFTGKLSLKLVIPGEEPQEELKCANCKATIDKGSTFCSKCGTKTG
jgi:hypothetical protein